MKLTENTTGETLQGTGTGNDFRSRTPIVRTDEWMASS